MASSSSSFAKMYWNNRPKKKELDDGRIRVVIPDITKLAEPPSSSKNNKSSDIPKKNNKETAPVLYKKVSGGDFQVWFKVSGFKKATTMKSMKDQVGLLIRESKNKYMRLSIEVCPKANLVVEGDDGTSTNTSSSSCSSPQVFQSLLPCIKTCLVNGCEIDASTCCLPFKTMMNEIDDSYWLSMKRCGNSLIAYCSTDGEKYSIVRVAAFDTESESLSVGVYGASPIGNGFKIIFDHFEVIQVDDDSQQQSPPGVVEKQNGTEEEEATNHKKAEQKKVHRTFSSNLRPITSRAA